MRIWENKATNQLHILNINADLLVKSKKEMTNVKDVLYKNQTLPLITNNQR